MNFQDLLSKIKQIDETTSVEECGMPMPGIAIGGPRPEQSDSVTMNVSMNGSGAGGIKDLMNILKNIEDGAGEKPHGIHGDDEIVIGGPLDAKMAELEDSYNNEPNPVTTGTNIHTGDDLASKGGEAEKVNGGGNPFNVDEALVRRLSEHYQSIKEGSDPKMAQLQQTLLQLVKKTDPTADISKWPVDGQFGPRTDGLLQYAATLVARYNGPDRAEVNQQFNKLAHDFNVATGYSK